MHPSTSFPPGNASRSRRRRRRASVGLAFAAVAGVVATSGGPTAIDASSHREAPLIAGDPRADNTDLYAFVSPDDPDTVTLISAWLPFAEPNGGPNFYPWADDTQYNIKIDNDGDALADITYTWVFDTVIRDPGQFLYNTGPVTSLTDPDLNYYQTYDLTVTVEGVGTSVLLGDGDGVHDPTDPIAAPSLVGPGSIPDYAPLMEEATIDLPGGGKNFVGQTDDPFFLDLRVFDLLYGGDLSEVGEDTLAGYNVNSIAIQVPKSALAGNGDADANPVIGIWSTTDRRSARAADGTGDTSEPFVQVSRLGNPLVNEVVFPLALKDAFNSISPDVDATIPAAVDAVTNPILPGLIEAIYGVPAPATPRNDLEEIFLQGVSAANAGIGGDPATILPVDLNGHDLNTDQAPALQPSEQLRLNMAVPTSAEVNRLSLFAGQFDGFPNGRRLEDDVVDIAIQTVVGAAQSGEIVEALAAGDLVDRNDRDFQDSFPYLALPHNDSVNLGPERPPVAPPAIIGDVDTQVPERVLDTRPGDGRTGFTGDKPAAGDVVEVQVAASTGGSLVDAGSLAVVANVTTVGNEGRGFVTAYNCDDARPTASSVNYAAGSGATSNLVVSGVSDDGTICLFTSASANLIVDVVGSVPVGSGLDPLVPERLLETRSNVPGGQVGVSGDRPAAGDTIELDVTQVGDDQVADDATAVLLNVTAVNAATNGFVTVYSCDVDQPSASSLNFRAGDVVPNLILAEISSEGTVCLTTTAETDLLADVVAQFTAASTTELVTPERILETRPEPGQVGYTGDKPAAGQIIEVQVTGVGDANVPADAAAAFLNVTTARESDDGFFTVFPCGTAAPTASTGNFRGASTASLTVAQIGDGGRVCVLVSAPTDVIIDLVGWVPA